MTSRRRFRAETSTSFALSFFPFSFFLSLLLYLLNVKRRPRTYLTNKAIQYCFLTPSFVVDQAMAKEARSSQQPAAAAAPSPTPAASSPMTLADVFAAVPEIAEMVIRELDPIYAERLVMKTDPALTAFFYSAAGGGLQRHLKISREGKKERRRISRLPDEPRLLVGEWKKRLIGKRLVAEDVQGDENMVGSLSYLSILLWLDSVSFWTHLHFLYFRFQTSLARPRFC